MKLALIGAPSIDGGIIGPMEVERPGSSGVVVDATCDPRAWGKRRPFSRGYRCLRFAPAARGLQARATTVRPIDLDRWVDLTSRGRLPLFVVARACCPRAAPRCLRGICNPGRWCAVCTEAGDYRSSERRRSATIKSEKTTWPAESTSSIWMTAVRSSLNGSNESTVSTVIFAVASVPVPGPVS